MLLREENERERRGISGELLRGGCHWRVFGALEDSVARKERFWATVRDRYSSGESGGEVLG